MPNWGRWTRNIWKSPPIGVSQSEIWSWRDRTYHGQLTLFSDFDIERILWIKRSAKWVPSLPSMNRKRNYVSNMKGLLVFIHSTEIRISFTSFHIRGWNMHVIHQTGDQAVVETMVFFWQIGTAGDQVGPISQRSHDDGFLEYMLCNPRWLLSKWKNNQHWIVCQIIGLIQRAL